MVQNWVIDYATPVSTTPPDVPVSNAFLRQLLVVLKNATSETEITTLTESPTTAGLEAISRAFTGGLKKVSYIKLEDLTTLNTFELRLQYYTIIAIGYTPQEIALANYGEYDGVIVYPTNAVGDVVSGVKNVAYCYGELGLKACLTFGKLLSGATFKNLAYTDALSGEETLQNGGIAEQWYDAKAIAWGYDDQAGSRLVSAFINGKGLSTPYIQRDLLIQIQTNSFNVMANQTNYTVEDAKLVQGYNQQIIDGFINAGLIISSSYSVVLDTTNTNTFIYTLSDLETPIPIFKIKINVIL